MDRKAFYHLYVNLNSLIELGMLRSAAKLFASLPDMPPEPELSEEEQRAAEMKRFENLDLSAMDQVWEKLRETPIDYEQIARDAAAAPPPVRTPRPDPLAQASPGAVPGTAPEDEFAMPDVNVYMQRAYNHEEELRERIDELFAKADLATMDRQLEQLGGAPAPLTAVLTGPQMEAWLERQDGEDEVLSAIATEMRRLEMEG